MPTSMLNAAMVLNVAQIDPGKLHNGRCYHVAHFRLGRSAFARD